MKKYNIMPPFLLYVGSFKFHKNLNGLFKAFSILNKQFHCSLPLVIIGNSQGMRYCEDVKQLCIQYPCIKDKLHFLQSISDVELSEFYRAAALFIFPSFYEGFGFPPLEAMSSKCATVISKRGALPEVCGDAAAYFDPSNPEELAAIIAELLGNDLKRKQLSALGLERSRSFCWNKSFQQHATVIDTLLK